MTKSIINNIKISAIYSSVPKKVISNQDFGKTFFNEESKDIIEGTGIIERRFCDIATTGFDLAIYSSKKMISDLNIDVNEIGAIVYVTFTPNYQLPGNSFLIHKELGIRDNIPAFDISLACSGYPYGLWISSLIAKNLRTKVLFLDSDKQSDILDFTDRSTAFLFADAGTATLIEFDEKSDFKNEFDFKTYSKDFNSIIINNNMTNSEKNIFLSMDGFKVFQFVLSDVKKSLIEFIDSSSVETSSIDYFIPHQANKYMITQLAKKIGFEKNKLLTSLEKYGNTSSSSIPLTISDHSNKINFKGKKLLLSGFGAGLSIANALVETSNCFKSEIFEYEQ
jgi:3-oxoacyl-[acyl-carrier-protein] synthase III